MWAAEVAFVGLGVEVVCVSRWHLAIAAIIRLAKGAATRLYEPGPIGTLVNWLSFGQFASASQR